MTKILILGVSGLLGSTLAKYLSTRKNIKCYGLVRKISDKDKLKHIKNCELIYSKIFNKKAFLEILSKKKPRFIINCCGVVKQIIKKKSRQEIKKINSYLPKYLNNLIYKKKNISIIHFTSDCVFSGNKGNYLDADKPDAKDFYGISKAKGEIKSRKVLNIRTSLIGHEVKTRHSLLEWFINQKKTAKGYSQAFFSGLTALEIAKILEKHIIFKPNFFGIYNLSGPRISKLNLLKIINSVYKLKIKITPSDELKIDRSLNCELLKKKTGYRISSWQKTIKEMYEFNNL